MGHFIVLEGQDGSGKSTQLEKLHDYLINNGENVIVTREPGGTPISEKIREILLDNTNTGMCGECEAYLYAAARAEHIRKVIKPALESGATVLCDRFLLSSLAYQGYGRELGRETVMELNSLALGGILPDITVYFEISPAEGLKRIGTRGNDRIESEGETFFEKVDFGYGIEARNSESTVVIDAQGTVDDVFDRLLTALKEKNII